MNKVWIIILIGLILRFVLMPITLHPDIKAYNLAGNLIAQKQEVLTFYDYISKLPRTDPLVGLHGDGQFNYPPLAYLTHGIFNLFLSPIYPQGSFDRLIYDYDNFRGSSGSDVLLFLLKLPYLLVDLAGLYLLLRMFDHKRSKLWAAIFWSFNPFTLYSAYMMGQFDIFIAVLILASLYFKSPMMLGLAAGFKPFPLVLLPFLPGNKIKNIIIGLATYIAILLPYLSSTAFKNYALFAQQSDKPLFAKVMVSGSQYIPLYVVGVVIAAWFAWYKPKVFKDYEWLSIPLLLFFSVTHFHPQWLTWLAPLLIIILVRNMRLWPIMLTLLVCFVFVVFSFDQSLNIGLFMSNTPVKIWVDEALVSLIRGVFAATALSLIFLSKNHE